MTKQSRYHRWEYAQLYDEDRFGGRFGKHLEQQEIKLFLGLVDGCSGKILDVGCGTGKLSLALLRSGFDTTLADFSAEMLHIALRKIGDGGLSAQGYISDIRALGFKGRTFRCTVSSRALMHVPDWRTAIAELCRVSSEAVVLDFPPRISFAGLDSLRLRLASLQPRKSYYPYQTFLVRKVLREFERNDFKVVGLRRSYFFPVLFHRWLDRPGVSERIERICRVVGLTHLIGAPVTVKAIRRRD